VVTGGAGFIGGHLVERLVRDGCKVVVIDNLSEGSLKNLAPVKKEVEFHQADIRDLGKIQRLFKGVDTVFHEAALRSVARSVKNPAATNDNNVTGTLNVLLAARDCGVRRVIFASSSSVYGPQKAKVFTEDLQSNPQSPYALTKLTGEIYLRQFFSLYGLETVNLRYFNVFGPRQDPASEYAAVIPRFVITLLRGKRPTIEWDGKQSRDFTYIDNVVDANILSMRAKNAVGEVINVSEGKSVSIHDLYEMIQTILKTAIKPLRAPQRPGDMRYTCGSTQKSKKLLGFRPIITFEEGLRRTVQWFIQHSD